MKQITITLHDDKGVGIDYDGLMAYEVLGLLEAAAIETRMQVTDYWSELSAKKSPAKKAKPKTK